MISIYPIIPALFLVLLASYYSQNYAGILALPLAIIVDAIYVKLERLLILVIL